MYITQIIVKFRFLHLGSLACSTGKVKDSPRKFRVNILFSGSYIPGCVAPNEWSIWSIVGITSEELKTSPLIIIIVLFVLLYVFYKMRSLSYQYLSLMRFIEKISITFRRWETESNKSLIPSKVRLKIRSEDKGSYKFDE